MEADIKTIIFLFIFILIGVVLFQPIYSEIIYITTPGTYTTVTSGTTTESSFVAFEDPTYAGLGTNEDSVAVPEVTVV